MAYAPISNFDPSDFDGFNVKKVMHSKGMKIFRFVADKALSYIPITAAEYRAVKYGVKGAKLAAKGIKAAHALHQRNKLRKSAHSISGIGHPTLGSVVTQRAYTPVHDFRLDKLHAATLALIKHYK